MTIDQKTVADLLQLGGQYFLPAAALLRALYSGIRGRFPEGFMQIIFGSLFAGLTAAVGHEGQVDVRSIILKIFGNTVFMAGLLSFIVVYLLRMRNRGLTFDAIIGGIIGAVAWGVSYVILDNPLPWWSIPVAIAGGAAGFVALRMLLRQIAKLVRVATYLIMIGFFFVLAAGGVLALQMVGVIGR
ncbi:MAG: hypothetical protein IT324_22565 [Anaerolineae bacterium]|nr:hypothetical protein [Anaerolineae bacterium]